MKTYPNGCHSGKLFLWFWPIIFNKVPIANRSTDFYVFWLVGKGKSSASRWSRNFENRMIYIYSTARIVQKSFEKTI